MKPQLVHWGRALSAMLLLFATGCGKSDQMGCAQEDIAGRWLLVVDRIKVPNRMLACEIRIEADGNISQGSCSTASQSNIPLTPGRIRVRDLASCSLEGFFSVDSALYTLTKATMANDKKSGHGEGTYEVGTFSFAISRR